MEDEDVYRYFNLRTEDALILLREKFSLSLRLFLLRKEFQEADIDDAIQTTWLKMFNILPKKSRQDFGSLDAFEAYIVTTGYRAAIDIVRGHLMVKGRRIVPLTDDIHHRDFDELLANEIIEHQLSILKQCVQGLDHFDRESLALLEQNLEGSEHVVLASIHDIASGTVASRISRIKGKVKECVKRKLAALETPR